MVGPGEHIDQGRVGVLASIGQRVGARVIDWGLLMMIWLLFGAATLSRRLDDGSLIFQRWAIIAWMALVVLYEAGLVARYGQTLGKRVLGIELVSVASGARLSFAAAFTRVVPVAFAMALLGSFFPIALVFVYFSAAFMADSRGLLDHLAGSAVVRVR